MDLVDAFIDFTETSLVDGLLLMDVLDLDAFGYCLLVEVLLFCTTLVKLFD